MQLLEVAMITSLFSEAYMRKESIYVLDFGFNFTDDRDRHQKKNECDTGQ